MVRADHWAALADQSWSNLVANRRCIAAARALLDHTARRLRQEAARAPRRPSARTRDVLAAAYEIAPEHVARDVEALARWDRPLDDYLTHVCRLHDWEAATGTTYLGALRSALLARTEPSPWDEL
jgi:hypothetical protein